EITPAGARVSPRRNLDCSKLLTNEKNSPDMRAWVNGPRRRSRLLPLCDVQAAAANSSHGFCAVGVNRIGLIGQKHAQQRAVDFQMAVVIDETEIAKLV